MSIKTADKNKTGYKAPAVHRVFELLRKVAKSREGLSLTELASTLGYSKSTTHGLVHALLREGALAQDADGRKFYLGSAVIDLAFAGWNYLKMVESVQSTLDGLRDRIKDTVVMGALICNRIMILAAAESNEPFKISASPGTVMSVFSGASGKVLLAGQQAETVKQLIMEKGLPAFTPRSIMDENAYLAELDDVRVKGFSVDDEEYLSGVRAVAVPLNNHKGPPMAIWSVGLSNKMGEDRIDVALANLRRDAIEMGKTIDKSIGY